jgi:hypothetical protein
MTTPHRTHPISKAIIALIIAGNVAILIIAVGMMVADQFHDAKVCHAWQRQAQAARIEYDAATRAHARASDVSYTLDRYAALLHDRPSGCTLRVAS